AEQDPAGQRCGQNGGQRETESVVGDRLTQHAFNTAGNEEKKDAANDKDRAGPSSVGQRRAYAARSRCDHRTSEMHAGRTAKDDGGYFRQAGGKKPTQKRHQKPATREQRKKRPEHEPVLEKKEKRRNPGADTRREGEKTDAGVVLKE